MSLPRLSIVVPVRNAAGDVDRLLDALERLEWPAERRETIVVDDASTDGTAERLATRPGITVLRSPHRAGSYGARNRGLEAATGAWVAFTDADCAPRADWLTRLMAEPIPGDVGAVVGEVLALEQTTAVQRFIEARGFMKHAVTLPHKALPSFSTANVAIRRDLLTRLGGFRADVLYFGDMELSWRMQIEASARVLFRPEAVVLHRHRRTVGGLWRQGLQHGRGVAFMREAHPSQYTISWREQLRRLGGIAAAPVASPGSVADRLASPFLLAVWYGGMAAGYAVGPSRAG